MINVSKMVRSGLAALAVIAAAAPVAQAFIPKPALAADERKGDRGDDRDHDRDHERSSDKPDRR